MFSLYGTIMIYIELEHIATRIPHSISITDNEYVLITTHPNDPSYTDDIIEREMGKDWELDWFYEGIKSNSLSS